MMDDTSYTRWWISATDSNGEPRADLGEPLRTVVAHVIALQGRIERLPEPNEHDRTHGAACRCYQAQCACAYDWPEAVCMTHQGKP